MKTGMEKGPLAFPHAGAFTLLVSLELQGRGKSSVSCTTSSNVMALPPCSLSYRVFALLIIQHMN
jgi:hypothetical protein